MMLANKPSVICNACNLIFILRVFKPQQNSFHHFTSQENERSKDIIIEQRFHRSLIGAGGQKIQELRDRFNGVQVMFRSPGEKSDVVTVRGPKDDVEKCAKHLKKLVDDLVSLEHKSLVIITVI